MFCKKCGKTIDPKYNVCMYCGTVITQEEDYVTQLGGEKIENLFEKKSEKPKAVQSGTPVQNQPLKTEGANEKPVQPGAVQPEIHAQISLKNNPPQQMNMALVKNKAAGRKTKTIILSAISAVVAVIMIISSFILGNISASKSWLVILKEETIVEENNEIVPETTKPVFDFNFGKTPMNEIDVIESSHYEYYQPEYTDALGNTFSNTHNFYSGSSAGYAVFYLDGNYKKLTGTIVSDADVSLDSSQIVYIYADDVLIYEKSGMNRGVDPIEFSVSVRDCRLLKIQTKNYNGTVRLADLELS